MSGRLHVSAVLTRESPRLQPVNWWLGGLQRWSRRFCQEIISLPCQESSSDFTAFQRVLYTLLGHDSIVGRLATSWTVRGSNPSGVSSALVNTRPGAHPASYTNGTRSLPGVKRPVRGVDHPPPPSTAEVKERVELYLHFPSGPLWPVLGCELYLYLTFYCTHCANELVFVLRLFS